MASVGPRNRERRGLGLATSGFIYVHRGFLGCLEEKENFRVVPVTLTGLEGDCVLRGCRFLFELFTAGLDTVIKNVG